MSVENPTLDDDSQTMDQRLAKKSDQLHDLLSKYIDQLPSDHSATTITKTVKIINEFELQPSLLDSQLKGYIDKLCQIYLTHANSEYDVIKRATAAIVYNLAKVRGFKVLANFFSSDVYLVVKLLELIPLASNEDEVFLNLIWFCNLVLVPFKFNEPLIERIYNMILKCLVSYHNGSKNQIVSSILLCSFLSRPDLATTDYVERYFTDVLENWSTTSSTEKLSHLMVFNRLLKKLPMNQIIEHEKRLFGQMKSELLFITTDSANSLNLLYLVKVLSKIGELSLKVLKFQKLEEIINSLIDIVKTYNDSFEITLRYAMAKSLSRINNGLSIIAPEYQTQFLVYLLSLLDLNLDLKFENYSGSVGRTTFKLIKIDYDTISIPEFHTVLLSIGYASLGKSLPVNFIPVVLSIVHRTLFTTQRRLNINLGSQLKDASCFIIWSVLRSLKHNHYKMFKDAFNTIFLDVVELTIFDSELVIRRCGCAVLQEFTGRFGTLAFNVSDTQKQGEKIIRFVELFTNSAVSSMSSSLNILQELARLGLSRGILVEMIMRNILKAKEFSLQAQYSRRLIHILKCKDPEDLKIGSKHVEYDQTQLENQFDKTDSSLYFKSEIWLNFNGPHNPVQFKNETEESYLKYFEFCCTNGINLQDFQSILFELVSSRRDLSSGFTSLLETASQNSVDLSWLMQEMCHRMSINISKCFFSYHHLNQAQQELVFNIIHATKVDYEIRTNLLLGLNKNFNRLKLDKQLIQNLTLLVNDYTTTEQGDVGSRIRGATIDIIDCHIEEFIGCEVELHASLIRISAEPMERLRNKSLDLLYRLQQVRVQVSDLSLEQYYKSLFDYYERYVYNTEYSAEFLRGLIFSAGGLTGDSSNINSSFRALIQFIRKEEKQNKVLRDLMSLLTKRKVESKRSLKEYIVALNLSIKLLESGIEIPAVFLKALFVKAYNLQINTNQAIRVNLTVNLMKLLSTCQEQTIRLQSFKRLLWILKNHKINAVRNFTLQSLFELIIGENYRIDYPIESVNIDDPKQLEVLEKHILAIEELKS